MLKNLFIGIIAGLFTVACALAGDAWQEFNSENTPKLAGDEIQFVEQINGTIWIGTLSGLSRYANGAFTLVEIERNNTREKANVQAWSIIDDGDGWLVGTNRGVYRMQDDLLSANQLENYMVAPLLRHADGTIWAMGKHRGAEKSTIFRLKDGVWVEVEAFAKLRVKDLLQTADGSMWVILDGDGAIRLRPGSAIEAGEHVQRGMNVTTVFSDSKDRVWVGFWGRGIAVETAGQWIQFLGSERSAVLRFAEDAAGVIWIATSEGLWHQTGATTFERFISDSGPVNLVFADNQGRIWVSAQRLPGLRYWDGKQWQVSLDSFLPIRCMTDAGNALWAGGVLNGVQRLER